MNSSARPISEARTYTARQIAVGLGSTPQAIRPLLAGVPAAGVAHVRGNETAVYALGSLPESLTRRGDARARRFKYRNFRALLEHPPRPWQPPVKLAATAAADVEHAGRLRAVLLPFLRANAAGEGGNAGERDATVTAAYADAFGRTITARYARKLFLRTLHRDAGLEDWQRLELYLPDSPRPSAPSPAAPALAPAGPEFNSLQAIVNALPPGALNRQQKRDVWHAAFLAFIRLQSAGTAAAVAAQRVRDFLSARVPRLARNRAALRAQREYRFQKFAAAQAAPDCQDDDRRHNGRRAPVPVADVLRLRDSAAHKNGKRIDCAWREEYDLLSAATRQRGSKHGRCPRAVVRAVSREWVKGLHAARQGDRFLNQLTGTLERDDSRTRAMDRWTMDDLTANVEVFARDADGEPARSADGTVSLFQPQIIVVQDGRSRKLMGWAMSLDKGPTAKLVAAAFLDALKRAGQVPHELWLENGWVFGRANAIVGKGNLTGDVIVAGLERFGCELHWYLPHSPTSKGELEGAFEALQRRMERLPGYTGREQRHDASEQFKREQREIRTGKLDPARCRFEFAEFVKVWAKIVEDFNATPQRGHLQTLSPNDAFARFPNTENPPITLTPDLLALLCHGQQRVEVRLDGVRFTDCGRPLRVRGGRLPEFIGRELWAFTDTPETEEVIFMTLDGAEMFIEPVCGAVDYREAVNTPGAGRLAEESRKIGQQRRAIKDHAAALRSRFGDPRAAALQAVRSPTAAPPDEIPARVPVGNLAFARNLSRGIAEVQARRAAVAPRRAVADEVRALAREAGLEAFADDYAAMPNGLELLRAQVNQQKGPEHA